MIECINTAGRYACGGASLLNLILRNLRVPVENDTCSAYLRAASAVLGLQEPSIRLVKILGKALDSSNSEQFYYALSLVIGVPDDFDNSQNLPVYVESPAPVPAMQPCADRPIILGFGPAGMFAAIELLARGQRPLIFERGRRIEERTLDVRRFMEKRELDEESNIQFGEGGAGTYSDGKLFSRMENSPRVKKVLDTFIRFGAPAEIAYIEKPHLGTDVLCKIVANIREHVLSNGGEIFYNSRMTDLIVQDGVATGVTINDGRQYYSSRIYMAIGHSARDTFRLLLKKGAAMEQRPISMGVRIEHPADVINRIRYGEKYKDFPGLGAAVYAFNYTDRRQARGAYTFCMCPGGEVVNASSSRGLLALNGMSYSRRAGPYSNAALVVNCHTADYGGESPLAGIEMQEGIERRAFAAGGGWRVPAQNLTDFLGDAVSRDLLPSSCACETVPADLRGILPDFICRTLAAAFAEWKRESALFVSDQALLLAPETRTSCPVRVLRDDRCQSLTIKNLYPIGEGSGYAGGITSSAADAITAVERSLSDH